MLKNHAFFLDSFESLETLRSKRLKKLSLSLHGSLENEQALISCMENLLTIVKNKPEPNFKKLEFRLRFDEADLILTDSQAFVEPSDDFFGQIHRFKQSGYKIDLDYSY